jgi:pyruvate/2-oxoglutarate dehydrogenase complex dihydrolipoamide acyltransferase (E2) component
MAGAQFDQQLRAYADAQKAAAAAASAARAAASRRSSGGGSGSGGTSVKKTSLSTAYDNYNAAKNKQKQTPIEKYVNTIRPVEQWRSTLSPTVSTIVKNNSYSPATTPYLSAYDKMKMLGL